MTAFMARHPLVSGVAMMSVQLVLLVASSCALRTFVSSTPGVWTLHMQCFWLVTGFLAFGAGFWLSLLRGRSCQSVWPVCWLAAIFPFQTYAQVIVAAAVWLLHFEGLDGLSFYMRSAHLFLRFVDYPGILASSPAVLSGLLSGQLVAAWMYRRSRWIRVSSLRSTTGSSAAPFLVRHALVATGLLMLPCLEFGRLFVLEYDPSTLGYWKPNLPAFLDVVVYLLLVSITAFTTGLAVSYSRRVARLQMDRPKMIVPFAAAVFSLVYSSAVGLLYGLGGLGYWVVGAHIVSEGPIQILRRAPTVLIGGVVATALASWYGMVAAKRILRE